MYRTAAFIIAISNIGVAGAADLVVLKESRIERLIGDFEGKEDLEPSGVHAFEGRYHVVFDDEKILVIVDDRSWSGAGEVDPSLNRIVSGATKAEGITRSASDGRWILIEEDRKRERANGSTVRNGRALEYRLSGDGTSLQGGDASWLPFDFERKNKGFEGVSVVMREGRDYLLALCEGNACAGKKKGRKHGKGRIKVFVRNAGKMERVASIKLPIGRFTDYSGLDVRGDRLAIVSQASSALWVGRLDSAKWRVRGDGKRYDFPKDPRRGTVYCNIEGVSWVSDDTVVVVSDARKDDDQGPECEDKQQSIHVFQIPAD